MKIFLKKIIPHRIVKVLTKEAILEQRILNLEEGRQNRRFAAIFDAVDYLVGAQIPGDYCEFGVNIGTTFSYAYRMLSILFPGMNYFAFDSFQGLPRPKGVDALGGFTSNFHEGEFSCTEEEFQSNLQKNHVDLKRVKTVNGWFDETLIPEKSKEYTIEKIAFAWIDCDLYESTVPVLKFIVPYLTVGSLIVFDDWKCFRNLPNYGEQRACQEWLKENPTLALNPLFSIGSHGMAFTINKS